MIGRHFTVDEANALIPILEPVMQDLQRLLQELNAAIEEIEEFEQLVARNGHGKDWAGTAPGLRQTKEDLQQRLEYLEGVGVQVKDLEHGILDFPTRMEGRGVLLCWRVGETEVAYWHDIESGYAGRTPL